MLLKKNDGRKFSWEKLIGCAYNDQNDSPNLTAAVIETTGEHGKVKNSGSDIIYFVAEGNGEFFIQNKWVSVEKDDAIFILRNSPYDFRAINSNLKLFVVHAPGYKPEDDEKLA
jgi:mannose-6-phosphate isomerase-like protein (cupin superfamily)